MEKKHFFQYAVRLLIYIRFVAVAFQLWRSSPLEKGPHRPIMALPWIHHCADLAQQSIQMCGSHEYSEMLVDNWYAFSLLLQQKKFLNSFKFLKHLNLYIMHSPTYKDGNYTKLMQINFLSQKSL